MSIIPDGLVLFHEVSYFGHGRFEILRTLASFDTSLNRVNPSAKSAADSEVPLSQSLLVLLLSIVLHCHWMWVVAEYKGPPSTNKDK